MRLEKKNVSYLLGKVEDLENRSRKNNLILYGIDEDPSETPEELVEKIKTNVFEDKLKISNWLQSELFVVTESKKLEHHLASLIDERKTIAMEIHIVEKQLKDPDMAQTDRVEHDARLHELKRALKEHNDDIAKLQQKILDVDPERHLKDLTSNVTDIIESPVVAKSLFKMLVAENITTYTTAAKLREQERATAEGQNEIQQLQAELQQAREDYDMKLTNLLKEHQELEGARKCKLVFLKHSANATLQSNPDLDTSIVEKLESQSKSGNEMSSFTFADLDTSIDFDSD
ncbi:hypothetical protein HPB51_009340 [Rhipicephalus microplus]|uniref:Uncharacterized protein n=1 Tax=Rhipicephalus microplus TaxID=6941 RepID=A0A9J6F0X1_RHIMP|nr:hypothetical protein HPB51_009340 [Rhipicephalus microplus]